MDLKHDHGPDGCWAELQRLSNKLHNNTVEAEKLSGQLKVVREALAVLGCPYELTSEEFQMWVTHTAFKLGKLVRK